MRSVNYIVILILISTRLFSQDSVSVKMDLNVYPDSIKIIQQNQEFENKDKFFIHGYIKNLESISFAHRFNNTTSYNLTHNRINLKWQAHRTIILNAELRNRIFWGNELKYNPLFGSFLKNTNEGINLQKLWFSRSNFYFHTNIERLYTDLTFQKFNLRIGRQRINWGISNTWNSNDIFNSFNFLDVDYEERPGADAVKLKYMSGDFSEFEMVYNLTMNRKSITSIRYFFNKWKYDFQIIAGWYKDKLTLGIGSAGNIGEYGFKSEMQFFSGRKSLEPRFNVSMDIDRVFNKGWYLQYGILINSLGLTKPLNSWNLIDLKITPENIMPAKWNFIAGIRKEISPIFIFGTSIVYAPGMDLFILLPRITYNLNENLDTDCIWQSFFMKQNTSFSDMKHICMIRLKYNF